jgi:hypothetical protein
MKSALVQTPRYDDAFSRSSATPVCSSKRCDTSQHSDAQRKPKIDRRQIEQRGLHPCRTDWSRRIVGLSKRHENFRVERCRIALHHLRCKPEEAPEQEAHGEPRDQPSELAAFRLSKTRPTKACTHTVNIQFRY